MGKLEVEERSGVSVTLPHTNGVDATKYTGPAKEANARDCILIFDHETGELTLERLSNQVNEEIFLWLKVTVSFLSDNIKKDQSRKEPWKQQFLITPRTFSAIGQTWKPL